LNKKISDKDKRDWQSFVSNNDKLIDKDLYLTENQTKKEIVKTIDLHGFSLEDANKTIEKFGTIDILVNNAGVHDFDNFLSSNAEKILKKMVDTHLYGSFYCTQAVIKEMKKNKRGDIIFITSLAEKQFMQEEWAYTSAKTAVSTMAQCIAKELRWDGIRVNCIAPTIVESDMGLKIVSEWANTKNHTELYKKVPFNRLVKPKDIGNLCVFLASDKASHISGQVIYLDSAIGPNSMRDIVQNKNI